MRNVCGRTSLRRMVAAAVSVCLVAAALSACASTDPPDSAETVHSQVGAGGFRIDHDDVTVSAEAGVADVGTDVSVAGIDPETVPAPGGMFQAFGNGIEVRLADGAIQPASTVHLQFALDPALVQQHLDAGHTLAVFTRSDTEGDVLPAQWDAQNNVLIADTTHLSPLIPGWLDPSAIAKTIGDTVQAALGLRFPKPDCVGSDAKLGSVTIKSSPVDRDVAWPCVVVADQKFHLQLHSNSAWTWLVTTKPDIRSFEVHGRDLAGSLAAGMFYGSKVDKVNSASVLVPGDTTTFPFTSTNPLNSGELHAEAGLSLVSVALNEISAAAELLHIKLGMDDLVKDVGKLSCLASAAEGLNHLSANDFGAKAGAFGKAVLDCVGLIGGFVGAVFLGVVAGIISALFVSFAGLWNTLTGQDAASFTISPDIQHALPDTPPPAANCTGNVVAHHDVRHPKLGTVRVFLVLKSSQQTAGRGCVAAVANNGKVVLSTPLDIYGDALHFASPATDSTANVFITYNPGRYNGVLVLVPTNDGFEDPGWSDTKYGTHYDGKRAYYYADLEGPGADGKYTIIKSRNDCHPDCAGGTITGQTLHWNGSDYTP